MYNKVFHVYFGFVVYCFYSVEKMDNFHFGLVKFGDSHENLLKLLLVVENFVFLKKKTISSMWMRRFRCLWSMYIVIIVFCKVVPNKCSLFLNWFRHWSNWLIVYMWIFWDNGWFNRRL